MQIILQATRGIVSGSPDFFKRAFGASTSEFESLLMRPERFLFNRAWYEELGGRAEFEQFTRDVAKLSESDKDELMALLSGSRPSQYTRLVSETTNGAVRSVLHWYVPIPKDQEAAIWKQAKLIRMQAADSVEVPDDERVEDAGLAEVA
jgi:hypothetical protein